MVVTKTSLNDLSCWNANLPQTSCHTDFVLACCYVPFCSDGSEKGTVSLLFCMKSLLCEFSLFPFRPLPALANYQRPAGMIQLSCTVKCVSNEFIETRSRPNTNDRQLNQTITTWSKYMQDSFKRRRTSQANLSWFEFTFDFMKYGAESLSVCSYTKPQSLGAHSKATPILAMKAELKRAMRASEASFVGKIGIPSSQESLVILVWLY